MLLLEYFQPARIVLHYVHAVPLVNADNNPLPVLEQVSSDKPTKTMTQHQANPSPPTLPYAATSPHQNDGAGHQLHPHLAGRHGPCPNTRTSKRTQYSHN